MLTPGAIGLPTEECITSLISLHPEDTRTPYSCIADTATDNKKREARGGPMAWAGGSMFEQISIRKLV